MRKFFEKIKGKAIGRGKQPKKEKRRFSLKS